MLNEYENITFAVIVNTLEKSECGVREIIDKVYSLDKRLHESEKPLIVAQKKKLYDMKNHAAGLHVKMLELSAMIDNFQK